MLISIIKCVVLPLMLVSLSYLLGKYGPKPVIVPQKPPVIYRFSK